MSRKIRVSELADVIESEFVAYSGKAESEIKTAVKDAADLVRDEIRKTAPEDTGEYRKSWAVKKLSESPGKLSLLVYSKGRYMLTHLLEYGHAKRNGGRVKAQPHIEPAERKGSDSLEKSIRKKIGNL